jgi:hypothetical protein
LKILLIALALFASGQALGQAPYPYLANLEKAEREVQQILASKRNDSELGQHIAWPLQALGTQRSFVGDTDGAIAAFQQRAAYFPVDAMPSASASQLDGLLAEPALEAIVRAARTRRIVILNEAHYSPRSRAFALQLARELRKDGFNYLACETFSPLAMKDGYPRVGSGYYSREPVYGQLLREAARDGWRFVPYEDETNQESGEPRDTEQANNLQKRIFAKDPEAKVLVFVGHRHVSREPDEDGGLWLAAILEQRYPGQTLAIDQTSMVERTRTGVVHPVYHAAVKLAGLQQAFVLRSSTGEHPRFGAYAAGIDIEVFHPPAGKLHGRADWLQTYAGRTPRAIPAALLPKKGRRLLQAFHVGENADAIPADNVLVEAGKPVPRFMLPPGQFRFTYQE